MNEKSSRSKSFCGLVKFRENMKLYSCRVYFGMRCVKRNKFCGFFSSEKILCFGKSFISAAEIFESNFRTPYLAKPKLLLGQKITPTPSENVWKLSTKLISIIKISVFQFYVSFSRKKVYEKKSLQSQVQKVLNNSEWFLKRQF